MRKRSGSVRVNFGFPHVFFKRNNLETGTYFSAGVDLSKQFWVSSLLAVLATTMWDIDTYWRFGFVKNKFNVMFTHNQHVTDWWGSAHVRLRGKYANACSINPKNGSAMEIASCSSHEPSHLKLFWTHVMWLEALADWCLLVSQNTCYIPVMFCLVYAVYTSHYIPIVFGLPFGNQTTWRTGESTMDSWIIIYATSI